MEEKNNNSNGDSRRKFLKKSALVGLAATLNPLSGFSSEAYLKKEFEDESGVIM